MLKIRLFAAAIPVLLAQIACAGPSAQANTVVSRDSAGITIVDNFQPAWTEGAGWRIGTGPLVQIGVLDGDPRYQFDDVEAVRVLDDGSIAVANGGSGEIRVYDSEGLFQRAIGRKGEGPGEFADLSNIADLGADGMLAFDSDLDRLTTISKSGEVVRTVHLERPGSPSLIFVSQVENGDLIFALGWSSSGFDAQKDGFYRAPSPILRYRADGSEYDTIGSSPGLEIQVGHHDDGRRGFGPPLFGHFQTVTAFGDRVYWGSQEEFEIGAYSADGTLEMLIRIPERDLTVTAADVEEVRTGLLAQAGVELADPSSEVEKYLRIRPLPERKAAYGHILADSAGFLWVAEPHWSRDGSQTWNVFEPTGRWLGVVVMPERFRVLEIGDDYIAGRYRDEQDVEFVRVYRLTR